MSTKRRGGSPDKEEIERIKEETDFIEKALSGNEALSLLEAQVVAIRVANPSWQDVDCANFMGMSTGTLYYHLNKPKVKSAIYRMLADPIARVKALQKKAVENLAEFATKKLTPLTDKSGNPILNDQGEQIQIETAHDKELRHKTSEMVARILLQHSRVEPDDLPETLNWNLEDQDV